MKHFLRALFSEHGSVSMIRLLSLISVLAAVMIAVIGLNKPQIDYSGLALLCGTFLGTGIGGKIIQKRTEVSGVKSES